MPWVEMEEIVESYGALVARSGPETGKENAGYAWSGGRGNTRGTNKPPRNEDKERRLWV